MAKKQEDKPFKKVSDKEYELQINGRTKTLFVPFGKVEKVFAAYVEGGGVIDEYGNVNTDILTLVRSFHSIGDIMLTEYDEETGKVITEGNCSPLAFEEVISLFQTASSIITDFIGSLTKMVPQNQTSQPAGENEK